MADITEEFEKYYGMVNTLIEQSSREQLAQSLLVLALLVAQYESTQDKISLSRASAVFGVEEMDEEQVRLLMAGMEKAIGILRYVATEVPDTKH